MIGAIIGLAISLLVYELMAERVRRAAQWRRVAAAARGARS